MTEEKAARHWQQLYHPRKLEQHSCFTNKKPIFNNDKPIQATILIDLV